MNVTTIEDVADKAGVSAATVDRIIHARGKSRASTVAKVKKAIEELGYRPNLAASTLARGRLRKIGLFIPDWEIEFLQGLAVQTAALENELNAAGASLHVLKSDEANPSVYAENFELFAGGLDACAVLAPNDPSVVEAVARLEERGIRIATIVTELPTSVRSLFVGPSNHDLGATAASLLLPILHRQDGYAVVFKPAALQEDHEARYVGFCKALRHAGIDPSRIKTCVSPVDGAAQDIASQALEELGQYAVLCAYMTGGGLKAQIPALAACQPEKPVTVATDLTESSRKLLLSQDVDFVVASDVPDMMRSAFLGLLRKVNEPFWEPVNAVQPVQVFTRYNLPSQSRQALAER